MKLTLLPGCRYQDGMKTKQIEAADVSRADRTRMDILTVATEEFADKGFSGARIDEIAERTDTSKRMIYYHFGSKEGLYRSVLEAAYGGIRSTEAVAELGDLPPLEALARLTEITFNYHLEHPEFVRLVMNENIQRGSVIASLDSTRSRNDSVIAMIGRLIERGVAEGVFRDGIDPLDLHMTMSSMAFYNISNRYTLGKIFGIDMDCPDTIARRRQSVIHTVIASCRR
jgi:AcrR family transcriptional regulator